ncbi:hypothetical protein [Neisseria shayeganii]|uniref:Uncharacterized protein n=1 Tax=Neisseria shayeganii TaxID=607712 RepID=A0A7D7N9W6_9NEIS|nr:hypothetical protein [Neisseria shayeganii]QMT40837.1 hypothetical protein H3L94_01900 [Neisseria shayeganii]
MFNKAQVWLNTLFGVLLGNIPPLLVVVCVPFAPRLIGAIFLFILPRTSKILLSLQLLTGIIAPSCNPYAGACSILREQNLVNQETGRYFTIPFKTRKRKHHERFT